MDVRSVEITDDEIEIKFTDGAEEEIENGRYERENAQGETIEERLATTADLSRLLGLAASFEASLDPIGAEVLKVERDGDALEITYADGSEEEIENGEYEREGPGDIDLIERPAPPDDIARLEAIAAEFAAGGGVVSDDDDDDDDDFGEDDDRPSGSGKDEYDDDHGGSRDDAPSIPGDEESVDAAPARSKVNRIDGTADFDFIFAGDGRDRISTGDGEDFVDAGAGDDRVRGGRGDDALFGGGAGADRYKGGGGADTFVFGVDGAADRIKDFQSGLDRVDISAFDLGWIDDVLNLASQNGVDVLVDLGGGDVIRFNDTSLSDLTSGDFIF